MGRTQYVLSWLIGELHDERQNDRNEEMRTRVDRIESKFAVLVLSYYS